MKHKDLKSVREYFAGISDLDRVIEEELIGTSMLPFIDGYTTFSCSGHVIDEESGFIITYPRIHFSYADTSGDAMKFHEMLTSIKVEYNGAIMDFRVSPKEIHKKIAMILGHPQEDPDQNKIQAKKVIEYALYSRGAGEGYQDHGSVKILEDFLEKYSEVLTHFLSLDMYQRGRVKHKIENGFLYTPFSHPPNRGMKIKDQYDLLTVKNIIF